MEVRVTPKVGTPPSIAPNRPEDKCTTGAIENLSHYNSRP